MVTQMSFRKLLTTALAVMVMAAGVLLGSTDLAHAAGTVVHVDYRALAAHAPAKKIKGGVRGAQVWCSDDSGEPPVSYYEVRVKKGSKVVATKKGAAAMERWIRVKPGKYTVVTTVGCGDAGKVVSKKVKIRRLKDKETVSRGEYKRLKLGMSRKKVEKIIGPKIRGDEFDDFVFATTVWNRIASVSIKKGKLDGKWWGSPDQY